MPRLLIHRLSLAVVVLLFRPAQASAGGVIVITHGDTVNHVGEIKHSEVRETLHKAGWPRAAVGYKYSYWGIFWIDLWTWGGEYCVFEDKRVVPLTSSRAADLMGVSESELAKPFLYRFPLGLLIVGGIAAVLVALNARERLARRRIHNLFQDERYKGALGILSQHADRRAEAYARWSEAVLQAREKGEEPPPEPAITPPDGGYEEAVMHLVRDGIPREEAEKNLNAIVNLLRPTGERGPS